VHVDQKAATGDDLLAAAEQPAAGRAPLRARGSGDGDDRETGGRTTGGGHRERPDLAAPDLDRAGSAAHWKRPDRTGLDHLGVRLQFLHQSILITSQDPSAGFVGVCAGNKLGVADIELTSTAFDDGEPIPRKYSCDGNNVSPPLSWSFLPEETRSLALIVHDPDAPSGDFTHWLAWNLDPEDGGLDEGAAAPAQGTNGRGTPEYMGPCPPPGHGAHRYFHHLYALDGELDLEPGAAREQLQNEIDGRVLAEARLMGTYERSE